VRATSFSLCRPQSPTSLTKKVAIYGILLKPAAETLITIAADAKHLGPRIGITAVLHTWGSASPITRVMILPGGGFSLEGYKPDARYRELHIAWLSQSESGI